jgi:FAD:protein FMN transferase
MRKIEQIMGMPVSLDIPGVDNPQPFESVFDLFREVDQRFSPYKADSELTRLQHGEVQASALSADMRAVMEACRLFEKQTDGYFSAYFAGTFDPTGYVKGWAIARAGELLEERGIHAYLINVAGDVLAHSNTEHVWRIGLQHPAIRQEITGTIRAKNTAVATSGTYERGQHILDPHTGKPATELLSVTVVGPDIAVADVFATAVFAMGTPGLEFVEKQPGYEALLIDHELHALTTSNFNTQNVQ